MNDESNHPNFENSRVENIDPELEARIVALVLGEASDFERDELERLIQQRPDLAKIRKQMEGVHGMLRGVGEGDFVEQGEDWTLPEHKRSALLATLRGEAPQPPATQPADLRVNSREWSNRRTMLMLAKIAAVVVAIGSIGLLTVPRVQHARESARATAQQQRQYSGDAERAANSAAGSAYPATDQADDAMAAISALDDSRSMEGAVASPGPYYLQDDVRYFPAGPKLKFNGRASAEAESQVEQSNDGYFGQEAPATDPFGVDSNGVGPTNGDGPVYEFMLGLAGEEQTSGDEKRNSNLDSMSRRYANGRGEAPPAEPRESAPELSLPLSAVSPNSNAPAMPDSPSFAPTTDTVMALRERLNDEAKNGPAVTLEGMGQADEMSGGMGGGGMGGGMSMGGEAAGGFSFDAKSGDVVVPLPPVITAPFDAPVEAVDRLRESLRSDLQESSQQQAAAEDRSGANAERRPADKAKADDADGLSNSLRTPGIGNVVTGEQLNKNFNRLFAGKDLEATDKESDLELKRKSATEGFRRSGQGVWAFGGAVPAPAPASEAGTPLGVRAPTLRFDQAESGQPQSNESLQGMTSEFDSDLSLSVPNPNATNTRGERAKSEKLGELDARRRELSDELAQLKKFSKERKDALQDGEVNQPSEHPEWSEKARGRGRQLPEDVAAFSRDATILDVTPRIIIEEEEELAQTGFDPFRKTAATAGLDEKLAAQKAFSTFSLHVSDVSFKLAMAALSRGEWPEAAKVRIEEFVNAFDYGDPMPSQNEKVACRVEQSIHPFIQQRNLLRVSMRTAAAGRASSTPLRLTFLLDNSGSMERIDRQQTVRSAFATLAAQLTPQDQVTLISFARQPRLLADKVSGAQSQSLVELIDDLPSEGGTNLEAALQLAFEKAREQKIEGAQNRIILLTDGAVNLGDANPESLSQMITAMRGAGIAFDAAGISTEGLNDAVLEALTRNGDGRYYLLDSPESADDGFARQIAGALRPSAKNVKVQVEFNPARVGRYKLLGFEKHILKTEDFRNDTVDAAEMAAAEAGVALYQIEALPEGEGDIGSVSVRFRDLSSGQMIENRWPIPYEVAAPRPSEAAPSLRIAMAAGLLAAKLRGEPLGETVDLQALAALVASLPESQRNTPRVAQLQQMIQQARQLSGP